MAARGSDEYKEASRLAQQRYRAAHPERAKEIARKSKERNHEKYMQKQRDRRATNPEIDAKYRRTHYMKHRDAILAKHKNMSDEQRAKRKVAKRRWDDRNKEHIKEYVRKNKESIAERTKRWARENREHILDVGNAWRSKNRSRVNALARTRRAANPEKERQSQREYHKRHPERRRMAKQVRRARKRNAVVGDTKAIAAWERGWRKKKTHTCHWCKKTTRTSECHADHVQALSNGGAHSLDNLVVSCAKCNQKKNNKPPDVFNKQLEQPLLFI